MIKEMLKRLEQLEQKNREKIGKGKFPVVFIDNIGDNIFVAGSPHKVPNNIMTKEQFNEFLKKRCTKDVIIYTDYLSLED